jgi:hypothetical protein
MPHTLDDSQLRNVHFLPYIGHRYPVEGGGTLVVGNSHYGEPSEDCRTFTRDVVASYPGLTKSDRFFTSIAKVLSGKFGEDLDAKSQLAQISFYNFCQELVGSRHDIKPTREAMQRSQAPFWTVVDVLRPRHVLVLGGQTWGAMPDGEKTAITIDGETRNVHRYDRAGFSCWAAMIWHPSTKRGFDAHRWHRWVAALRSFPR